MKPTNRRIARLGLFLVPFLMFASTLFGSTGQVSANTRIFPGTLSDSINEWGVVGGGCFNMEWDNGGIEYHSPSVELQTLGSQYADLVLDVDPTHLVMIQGSAYLLTHNNDRWDRYGIPKGTTTHVIVTGGCDTPTQKGFGLTVYQQNLGNSAPASAPQTYTAPANPPCGCQSAAPPPPAADSCTLDANRAAQLTGGNAAYFSPLPGSPNGQKYGGNAHPDAPAVALHSGDGFEVLTPNFPAQPGLPKGQTETTTVASVYVCP